MYAAASARARQRSRWALFSGLLRDVDPGDTIMVPPNTEVKVRTRSLIRDIAQIVGSLALGAAGVAAVLK
jgi:hypothetical protein